MYVAKGYFVFYKLAYVFRIIQVKDDEDRRLVKLQTQIEQLSTFNKDKVIPFFFLVIWDILGSSLMLKTCEASPRSRHYRATGTR